MVTCYIVLRSTDQNNNVHALCRAHGAWVPTTAPFWLAESFPRQGHSIFMVIS